MLIKGEFANKIKMHIDTVTKKNSGIYASTLIRIYLYLYNVQDCSAWRSYSDSEKIW